MNVIHTKAVVNTLVSILKATITVTVTMDIVLMVMTRDVHVSYNSIKSSLVITIMFPCLSLAAIVYIYSCM